MILRLAWAIGVVLLLVVSSAYAEEDCPIIDNVTVTSEFLEGRISGGW